MTPIRIIWHHSADGSQAHQFDKINLAHKDRDFPRSFLGYYVGYHYLIEPDGQLRTARQETEIGAHSQGNNFNSIGICLAGNFSHSLPSKQQEWAAARLVDDIIKRWNIPVQRIEPHRWGKNTECPGLKLNDYWLAIIYLRNKVWWLKRLLIERQLKIPK